MEIKSGDTLSKIAKKNGMTLKALLSANPSIKNANQIRVGQNIVIPPKSKLGAGEVSKNPYEGFTRTQMNMLNHKNKNEGAQEGATTEAKRQRGRTTPNAAKTAETMKAPHLQTLSPKAQALLDKIKKKNKNK